MGGRQEGAALAVGLVFLLVLTIFGISSLSTTLLEEKMSANVQEQNRSFQTGEQYLARILAVGFDASNAILPRYLEQFSIGEEANITHPSPSSTDFGCSSSGTDLKSLVCKAKRVGENSQGCRGTGYLESGHKANPYGDDVTNPTQVYYGARAEVVNAASAKATVNIGLAFCKPPT